MTGRNDGLDGIRALAVLAIMAYHQPFSSFPGGFIAVTMFFTLSGFLITGLLVDDLGGERLDLRRFYVRRACRLLPAAYVAIAGVVLVWWVRGLRLGRGDVVSSVLYVQNWNLAVADRSYAELFSEPSPLEHLWTLAIEEQFYVFWPLMLLAGWRLARGRRGVVLTMVAGVAVLSFALAPQRDGSDPWTYFNTFSRAGEFLIGAALAVAVRALGPRHSLWRTVGHLGWPALAGWGLLVGTVDLGASASFPGATLAAALACALVIVGCLSRSSLRRVLGIAPLAVIGRASYSLYLVHWPVFLLIPHGWRGVDGIALFAVRVAVSGAVGGLLHVLVEEPLRRTRQPRRLLLATVAPVGLVTLGISALVATASGGPLDAAAMDANNRMLLEMAAGPAGASSAGSAGTTAPVQAAAPGPVDTAAPSLPLPTAPPGGVPTTAAGFTEVATAPATSPPDRSIAESSAVSAPFTRLLFAGDSTAWTLVSGVEPIGATQGVDVEVFTRAGCGISEDTPAHYLGETTDGNPDCARVRDDIRSVVASFDPDVVLVSVGLADLADRQVDGVWTHVGEPDYDAWLAARIGDLVSAMSSECSRVVWLTTPHFDLSARYGAAGASWPEGDPARADRYNEILHQTLDGREGVRVVDFDAYLAARPGGEVDPTLRPDGVHLASVDFPDIAAWLFDQARAAPPLSQCTSS